MTVGCGTLAFVTPSIVYDPSASHFAVVPPSFPSAVDHHQAPPLLPSKRLDFRIFSSPAATETVELATASATNTETSQDDNNKNALSMLGKLDVRRFDMLVNAGPMDFQGLVHEIPNEDLDWNTTIFYTVTDPQLTDKLQQRFGQRPLWADSVIRQACDKAVHLPPQQYYPPPALLNFMLTNAELKNEHADGGFMDHLDFCAEYCTRYFPESSPNVLFLHSICGVGTNLFPLDFDKIPELETLLTPRESLHIQAFPCMLRLLFCELMDVLFDAQPIQGQITGITITTYHGTTLTLEGDDFWAHLNYHLIHLLDFLPAQNFEQYSTMDFFTRLFIRLHELLRKEGKLLADVRLDRLEQVPGMSAGTEDKLPTWQHLVSKANNPQEIEATHKQFGAQLREYSKAIKHDLSYQLHWAK
jgi:hypothetical protein